MSNNDHNSEPMVETEARGLSRRSVLVGAAGGALTLGLGGVLAQVGSAQAAPRVHRPARSTTALLIGVRVKDTDWNTAVAALGSIQATKLFAPGTGDLPSSYDPSYPTTDGTGTVTVPSDVSLAYCFNTATAAAATGFLNPVPNSGKCVLVAHQEPEGDSWTDSTFNPPIAVNNGSDFCVWFTAVRNRIKAINPAIGVWHDAASSQYAVGGAGYDGSWVPTDADGYAIDTYQHNLDSSGNFVPLSSHPPFQRWLSWVQQKAPSAAVFAVPEYGRGIGSIDSTGQFLPPDPSFDQPRAAVITADDTYLRSIGRFVAWEYWWTTGTHGSWRFLTDQNPQSVAAWQGLARG